MRINLSKSGASTSIGTRGAHVTLGHGKVRETVGLPGSGISYSETRRTGESGPGAIILLIIALAALAIFLAACAAPPTRWERGGATERDLRMELAQCRADALKATAAT